MNAPDDASELRRASPPNALRGLPALRDALGYVGPQRGGDFGARREAWGAFARSDDGLFAWEVQSHHFARSLDLRRAAVIAEIGHSRAVYRVVGHVPWCRAVVLNDGSLRDAETLVALTWVARAWTGCPLARCARRRLVALPLGGAAGGAAVTRVGRRHATELRVLPVEAPFAFSPRGDVFVGTAPGRSLRVLSVDAGEARWEAALPQGDPLAVAVADGGEAAYALVTKDAGGDEAELVAFEAGGAVRWRLAALARREPALAILDGLLRHDDEAGERWHRLDTGAEVARPPHRAPSWHAPTLPADRQTFRHVGGRYVQVPRPPTEPLHAAGHDAAVEVVAPSPDGCRVAAADARGRVAVHRLGLAVPERCLYVAEGESVAALAWSTDGAWLAVVTTNTLVLWEARDDGAVHEHPLAAYGFAPASVEQVVLGADALLLAARATPETVTLSAFDLATGALRWRSPLTAPPGEPLTLRDDGAAVLDEAAPSVWRELGTGLATPVAQGGRAEAFPRHGAARCGRVRITSEEGERFATTVGARVLVRGARPRSLAAVPAATLGFMRRSGETLLLVGTAQHGVLVLAPDAPEAAP